MATELTEAPARTESQHEAVLHEALSGLDKPAGEQKTLSPWLFYDERGSDLFEQITDLPEYYPTRTERSIFQTNAEEIALLLIGPENIVELGAGSASKTGTLLKEFATWSPGGLLYQPIDISPTALDQAKRDLQLAVPGLRVEPQIANYITQPYSIWRSKGQRVLALYIGSSIGNFSPVEATSILRRLRSQLEPHDALLLGVDLAPGPKKTVEELIAAYDDAQGVTAAFNTNVLVRLNRDLDTNFDSERFAHRARWNAVESRMEMHLESLAPQTVYIDGRAIHFAFGETIHTENSYKFTEQSLEALITSAGFSYEGGSPMLDEQERFAVALVYAV